MTDQLNPQDPGADGTPQPESEAGNTDDRLAGEFDNVDDLVDAYTNQKKRYGDSSVEGQRLAREVEGKDETIRQLTAALGQVPQVPQADTRQAAIKGLEEAGIAPEAVHLLTTLLSDVAAESVGAVLQPLQNAGNARRQVRDNPGMDIVQQDPALEDAFNLIASSDPQKAAAFARSLERFSDPQAIADDASVRDEQAQRKTDAGVITPRSTSRTGSGGGGASRREQSTSNAGDQLKQLHAKWSEGDAEAGRAYMRLRLTGPDGALPQSVLDGTYVGNPNPRR